MPITILHICSVIKKRIIWGVFQIELHVSSGLFTNIKIVACRGIPLTVNRPIGRIGGFHPGGYRIGCTVTNWHTGKKYLVICPIEGERIATVDARPSGETAAGALKRPIVGPHRISRSRTGAFVKLPVRNKSGGFVRTDIPLGSKRTAVPINVVGKVNIRIRRKIGAVIFGPGIGGIQTEIIAGSVYKGDCDGIAGG